MAFPLKDPQAKSEKVTLYTQEKQKTKQSKMIQTENTKRKAMHYSQNSL